MWISKWDYHNLKAGNIRTEERLNFQIRLLKHELEEYRAREEAAPEGCMTGTHCAGCKNVIITDHNGKQKYDCKLVAAKLCNRFEEATP